eukprot:gene6620-7313_t
MGTAALVPSRGSCELPESSKESASDFVAALELAPEKCRPVSLDRQSESKGPRLGTQPRDDGSTKSFDGFVSRRKLSLADMLSRSHLDCESGKFIFSPSTDQITVGDIVRVHFYESEKEGIVIEKLSQSTLRVDFGEFIKECTVENCQLLVRSVEFEVGDKVEARPHGSTLFFVGKVIKVHEDKSIDVLMDGDDPDDIETNIPLEEARKLMSRRSVVVSRWKRAFMLVIAANFFKRIAFKPQSEEKHEEKEAMREEK